MVLRWCIASDAHNYWFIFKNFSKLFGSLDSIHHRHIKISKYELIFHPESLSLFHHLYSLHTVHAEVYLFLCVNTKVKKNGTHRRDAEFFVIDYKDAVLSEFFKGFKRLNYLKETLSLSFLNDFNRLIFLLSLFLLIFFLIYLFKLKSKEKGTTFLVFGNKVYVPIKFIHNEFTYH